MHTVRAKLNSRRGVSIILAMVFFLICAIIGSIVLASAMSNAGRLSHMRPEQQAYLTVSSAAKLVRDELDGMAFRGEYNAGDNGLHEFSRTAPAAGNSLTGRLETMARGLYDTGANPAPGSFAIGSGDDTVTADISFGYTPGSTSFKVAVVLTHSAGGTEYKMTVNVPAEYTVIYETRYNSVTEPDPDNPDGPGTIVSVPYTVTITTISLGRGAISVGGGT